MNTVLRSLHPINEYFLKLNFFFFFSLYGLYYFFLNKMMENIEVLLTLFLNEIFLR